MDLVVARHSEDLNWLRRVPHGYRVFVYNKGTPAPLPERTACAVSVVGLPNVGREAHAYLHHVRAHYEALADLTVFVQGKPFDHAPDLHQMLKRLESGADTIDSFRWLGFLIDRDDRTGSKLFQTWSKNPERRPLGMEAFWRALFGRSDCPGEFVFFGGAQFAVTRDAVHRRQRSFYEHALAVAAEFPDAAHCFERIWDRVFEAEGIPPEHRGRDLPVYLKPIRRLMTD